MIQELSGKLSTVEYLFDNVEHNLVGVIVVEGITDLYCHHSSPTTSQTHKLIDYNFLLHTVFSSHYAIN